MRIVERMDEVMAPEPFVMLRLYQSRYPLAVTPSRVSHVVADNIRPELYCWVALVGEPDEEGIYHVEASVEELLALLGRQVIQMDNNDDKKE